MRSAGFRWGDVRALRESLDVTADKLTTARAAVSELEEQYAQDLRNLHSALATACHAIEGLAEEVA